VGLSLFSCFLSLHVVTRLGVDYPMVEASGLTREGHSWRSLSRGSFLRVTFLVEMRRNTPALITIQFVRDLDVVANSPLLIVCN